MIYSKIFFTKLRIFIFFSVVYCSNTFIYTQSTDDIGVRGYHFGETYATVVQQEINKQEFTLIPSKTNQNRLVYKGSLFNNSMNLIYYFKKNRLIRVAYFWGNITDEILFDNYLQRLLSSKYQKSTAKKNIKSLTSDLSIQSYIKSITNKKEITPFLYIELEKITTSNSNQAFILEFQPYDSDALINKKILLEDI